MADIARCAGINRSTFYAHFPDKEAVIRDELGRLKRELRARQEVPTPLSMSTFDPDTPHPNAVRWFEHVGDNADFYGAVLVSGELAGFEREIEAQIRSYAAARLRAWPGTLKPEIPLDALIAASTALNIGLLRWWLEQHPRPSPPIVAVIQQRLMARGVLPLLGVGPGVG
ncbi:MAG: TetR/AcrR family transcriptional regulator [Pararhodobacter sp.]|nr:TetR/AcrR family transcriptional regulator [Pararhodobacter sp.]